MSVDVTGPRLIEQFVAQHVGVVLELCGHRLPKLKKGILDILFVIIQALPEKERRVVGEGSSREQQRGREKGPAQNSKKGGGRIEGNRE